MQNSYNSTPPAPATSPTDEKIPEPTVVPTLIATAAHKAKFSA